jgi:hypothetical protein
MLTRDAGCRRGQFPGYVVPVAFELLDDELRDTGKRTLPHFVEGTANDDGIVGSDHEPRRYFRRIFYTAGNRNAAEWIDPDREPAADRSARHEE